MESPVLRVYLICLRLTFIFSAFTFVTFLSSLVYLAESTLWLIPISAIVIHQAACAFALRFLTDNLVDLVWLVCNTACIAIYIWSENITGDVDPWSPHIVTIHVLLCWFLLVLLSLQIALRVYFITRALIGGSARRPFYLLRGWRKDLSGLDVLFGASLWKGHFIGETTKLILARGFVAGLVLIGIGTLFFISTFAQPIRELRLIPTQNIRTPDTFTPVQDSHSQAAVWGVVVATAFNNVFHGRYAHFKAPFSADAVTVLPLWDDNNKPSPSCSYLPEEDAEYYEAIQVINFYCPSRIPIDKASSGKDILPQPYNDFQPDLLVTVNFTKLGIPSGEMRNAPKNSVQIMTRMTNSTDDVIAMTVPTTLMPGVNLVGIVSYQIHQTFREPQLSFLGLFGTARSTVIGQIIQVHADQLAGVSSLIPRSPEIGTIRLIGQTDSSQWIITRDSKEKSLLSGLAQTGGLWTFLSGIFAAIFGSSLMRILFGTKPISVFGLAHTLEGDVIRKAYRRAYPAMEEELAVPLEQRGLLTLIRDHLVDLSLLQSSEDGMETKGEHVRDGECCQNDDLEMSHVDNDNGDRKPKKEDEESLVYNEGR